MKKIKGFLIDLDGVIYIEDQTIPGAVEAVNWLRQHGFPFRFLTNTTMRSRDSLVAKLSRFGIQAETGEMVSTAVVAAKWLAEKGVSRVQLLVTEDARKDFAGFHVTDNQPEVVVVGDLGPGFTFDILNSAFLAVKAGARLVALQKSRYWQTKNGLAMDAGAFVAALEYATESEAELIGKPNRAYFEMALRDIGLDPSEVAMIGDDIYTDIIGAQTVGVPTILVRTGKYQFDADANLSIVPDWTIDSIADLPALLGAQ
ncbi:MAG: TIGR01458 family HAD-type hydrolase [Desulfobacterales bacterium]|nr:MAG: TIGR01458 family HAD-type hydrolase [Desulfobacterales bacterium]